MGSAVREAPDGIGSTPRMDNELFIQSNPMLLFDEPKKKMIVERSCRRRVTEVRRGTNR